MDGSSFDYQNFLQGKLLDPSSTLKTDSRTDPRLVVALARYGCDENPLPMPLSASSTYEDKLQFFNQAEDGYEGMFAELVAGLPEIENVSKEVVEIKGADSNDISLYIHRPTGAPGKTPCIYHIHGGGMTLFSTAGPLYSRWRDELAALDLTVVGVEFRNAAGKLGSHPFPAGLNDCMSGLRWVHSNRKELGISRIVVSGESGGGNLTLALALKARKEGFLECIDGVYALCPYISNAYLNKPISLLSLHENDEYFFDSNYLSVLSSMYDPEGKNAVNPLCWPYFATRDNLLGLPPHVVSVNELDPLRDEGLAYYRALLNAGVNTCSRTVNGTCHGADIAHRKALPDVYAATIRDIKGFAESLV